MAPGAKAPVPPAPTTRVLPDARSSQDVIERSERDTEEMVLPSSAVIPAAEQLGPPPLPPPAHPTARTSSADMAPRAPLPSISDAGAQADVAERVQAILTDVLVSTLAPILEKQRELEARLEALKAVPPARAEGARPPAASIDITGSLAPGALAPSPSAAPAPRPSMISTSYGLVSVMPGPPPRPAIEEALERVGPIDVPDFAGKRKWAGRIVVGVLLLAVAGAILAMVISRS